jgi:pectate lyase
MDNLDLVKVVKQYADRMLELQSGIDGADETPLFADGFNVDTLQPVEWLCGGETWTLSNFASQQNWLRLLVSLSALTGEAAYREAAERSVRYAFGHLRYGRLFQWGGHLAYDLKGRQPVHAPDKGPQHELKAHYPFYELMNDVNPAETKAYIEAFWNSHVLNWANLEFSRHGKPAPEPETGTVWDREYIGGAPFFTGTGLTFINAGSDLYYAAGLLHRFTGDERPLVWAKRLNRRYADTRHPDTGLSGYQFSISVLPGVRGDRAIAQFGEQLKEHSPLEGKLSVTRQIHMIIGKAALCRMVLAESLGCGNGSGGGEVGREFLDSAVHDLLAYGTYSYEPATNLIHPVLTDGTRLTGLVMERSGYYGKAGQPLQAAPADGLLLWSYALGFRLACEPQLWSVVRGIAAGLGLGDFGADALGGEPAHANLATGCADPYAVFALLELHRATANDAYLKLAAAVCDNIAARSLQRGLFTGGVNRPYAKLDSVAPLALLHFAAEQRGVRHELPAYCGGSAFFGSAYDGKGHMTDQQLFYSAMR